MCVPAPLGQPVGAAAGIPPFCMPSPFLTPRAQHQFSVHTRSSAGMWARPCTAVAAADPPGPVCPCRKFCSNPAATHLTPATLKLLSVVLQPWVASLSGRRDALSGGGPGGGTQVRRRVGTGLPRVQVGEWHSEDSVIYSLLGMSSRNPHKHGPVPPPRPPVTRSWHPFRPVVDNTTQPRASRQARRMARASRRGAEGRTAVCLWKSVKACMTRPSLGTGATLWVQK